MNKKNKHTFSRDMGKVGEKCLFARRCVFVWVLERKRGEEKVNEAKRAMGVGISQSRRRIEKKGKSKR